MKKFLNSANESNVPTILNKIYLLQRKNILVIYTEIYRISRIIKRLPFTSKYDLLI